MNTATLPPPVEQTDPERPTVVEVDTVYVRSPRALGAALGTLLASTSIVALVHLLNRADVGLRDDMREAVAGLPDNAGYLVDSLAMTTAVVLLLGHVLDQLLQRRARAAITSVVATALAGALPAAAVAVALGDRWIGAAGWGRGVAIACGAAGGACAAAALVSGGRWVRWGIFACTTLFLVGGAWATESVVGRALWLLAGASVTSVGLLVAGIPSRRATAAQVAIGLERIGMPARTVTPSGGDARGSVPWIVELDSGTRVFAKTASAEERIADLLFRAWRRVQLKDPGDARPAATLQQAAEHEAFVASRAQAVGVRAPRVLGLGELPEGGVFSVHEVVSGRSLDQVVAEDGPDALGEAALREAWSMVTTLHRAHIAHRDLRAANVILDDEGKIWLIDFAFSDVVATDELCERDLVELLASTAALVGTERAVDAALTTLGEGPWAEALPMVQPLATSSATRSALGTSGFRELRERLADRTQSPEPELPRLARIDRRALLSVLALGVATWTFLPQLADSDGVWEQIPKADPVLLALAAVFSMLTYVGATSSLRGSVPQQLPIIPAFMAQLASSFANRVTPAKVGGLALNARWMVKRGVQSPVAAAGISVNAFAGFVVHVVLTIFVVMWAGRTGLGDLETPPARTLALAAALVAAVIGLTYAIPPLRRMVRHRVWPRTRQSLSAVAEVATSPRRLVMLFGGSLVVTSCYVAALALSLAAVGESLPVPTVALVYLAGSALASAAPTPGGLGAAEATFAAGLTAVGVDSTVAVSAVLLYRLLTFWMPIVPGWLAFAHLRRGGEI